MLVVEEDENQKELYIIVSKSGIFFLVNDFVNKFVYLFRLVWFGLPVAKK